MTASNSNTTKNDNRVAAKPAKRASKTKAPAPDATPATPTPAAAPNPPTPPVFLQPPPAGMTIPSPPAGYSAPSGANYRAYLPRATEVAELPGAIADLQRCTTYSQIFGATALPFLQVLQALQVGNDWTTMHKASKELDAYCKAQEGSAWMTICAIMDRLRPAYEVATAGDPSLASNMPALTKFLGAKKAIAQKAVSTRQANKAAVARGEAPTHGTAGKKRQRAAEKAAYEATAKAQPPAAPVAPAGAGTSGSSTH